MKIKSILAAIATTTMLISGTNAYALSPTPKGYIVKYDLDHNGVANAVDASIVLTEYANTSTGKKSSFNETEKWIADFDYDKVVNAVDASGILSYYAEASVKSDKLLEEVFVKYYVEIRNNNEAPERHDFLTYEECLAYIDEDKLARPKTFSDNFKYLIYVDELHYGEHKREFSFDIYYDEMW